MSIIFLLSIFLLSSLQFYQKWKSLLTLPLSVFETGFHCVAQVSLDLSGAEMLACATLLSLGAVLILFCLL